jgi:hypothetical protein
MKREEILLLVTFLPPFEENLSFVLKENFIKNRIESDLRVRFFHSFFQSKYGTLNRILREERDCNISIIFQKNVPSKKVSKIMDYVVQITKTENISFSTSLKQVPFEEYF